MRRILLPFALIAVLACSSSDTPTPGVDASPDVVGQDAADSGSSGTLTLAPANTVLVIDAAKGSGATATYAATLASVDVTSKTTFTVPSTYGSFTGAIFTSALTLPGLAVSGTTKVDATTTGGSGSTKLSLIRLAASGTDAKPFVILPYGQAAKSLKTVVKVTPVFASAKDVVLALSNSPSNGANDATKLVVAVAALAPGEASLGCPAHTAKDTDADGILDTFFSVTSGTPLCWEVTFKDNASVAAQPDITTLVLDAVATGQPNNVKVPSVPVYAFVPPTP